MGRKAIQLQCGDYGPIRFHLRLFEAGQYTLANVHFELLIPNTTEHQVLSWELAEQLVVADFARSGLLSAPPSLTAGINPAPWREIPAQIYNGVPVPLRAAIRGPLGNVSAPVPIGSDGRATILQTRREVGASAMVDRQEFVSTSIRSSPSRSALRPARYIGFRVRSISGSRLSSRSPGTITVTSTRAAGCCSRP